MDLEDGECSQKSFTMVILSERLIDRKVYIRLVQLRESEPRKSLMGYVLYI